MEQKINLLILHFLLVVRMVMRYHLITLFSILLYVYGAEQPTLTCLSPIYPQRIAGKNIEFSARLTFPNNPPSSINQYDLCGSFNGNELCGLIETGKTVIKSNRIQEITWSLSGFLPSHQHTYLLWIKKKDTDNANSNDVNQGADDSNHHFSILSTCESSFETVHFPGWDDYVQSFYNSTQVLQQLATQPEKTARVGHPNFPINSFERLPDLIGKVIFK